MGSADSARSISREALYELVWSEPLTKVGARLGVSDVAVAKWCKRLDVPRPGRGYWAKLSYGKAPAKPALPPATPTSAASVVVHHGGVPIETVEDRRYPPDVEAALAYWAAPDHIIVVAHQLGDSHRLVARTRAAFSRSRVQEGMLLTARTPRHLALSVTGACLDRALRILDALIRALDLAGWPVVIEEVETNGSKTYQSIVNVLGEKLQFSLGERFHRHERPLTPEEKRSKAKDPWFYVRDRFNYAATGRLVLRIDSAPRGVHSSWSDGVRQRLEQRLPAFAQALALAVDKIRRDRVEAEERERRWAAEAERRRKLAEQRVEEQRWEKALEVMLEARARSRKIRELAAAVEALVDADTPADEAFELTAWCEWARTVAARDEPVRRGAFLERFERARAGVQVTRPWYGY